MQTNVTGGGASPYMYYIYIYIKLYRKSSLAKETTMDFWLFGLLSPCFNMYDPYKNLQTVSKTIKRFG